ncbi:MULTISPECIES: antitoxin [Streptomyces]|uniref:antitoxin n=1 Tax=Streptomyces TaxID=1883 RepID=UPI0022491309|nr:antitoxin [Streptomyces sp. JHD 1]MCX2971370.1 antitoxin [Streptomyces sp. JHD 1]
MSMLDKLKALLVQHEGKVGTAVDRATRVADRKTRGKYSRQLRAGGAKAKQATAKLADKERRAQGGPGQGGPGGPGHEGRGDSGGHRPGGPGF